MLKVQARPFDFIKRVSSNNLTFPQLKEPGGKPHQALT